MKLITKLAGIFVLGLVVDVYTQDATLCREIEPCLDYFEGPCSGGNRQVCLSHVNRGICAKTGAADGACFAGDFSSFRSAAPGTITVPWNQGVLLCKTVAGGSTISYGWRDTATPPATSGPRSIMVSGSNMPATCSDYTSVCDTGSNLDIKLDFKVTTCATNSMCDCSPGYTNSGSCSVSCGGGIQQQKQECRGSGCTQPTTTFRTVACNTQACPNPNPPVNGGFTAFVNAGRCKPGCGNNRTRKQVRTCTNPPPSNGGAPCSGPTMQQLPCRNRKCPNCSKKRKPANRRKCEKRLKKLTSRS